jgi:hypothetical protein
MVNPTIIIFLIAVLVSASAIYNTYLLRGGKLAWSQVMIVMAMISFIFSIIFPEVLPGKKFLGISISDVSYTLGFLLLLAASLKLRFSLK